MSNGWLATITNALENDYISSITSSKECWIGLNDLVVEGSYQWRRGGNGFKAWNPGDPNNLNNVEDCVIMWGYSRMWIDLQCSSGQAGFVCQTCPPGMYSGTGTSPVCQVCPIGSVAPTAGASACTPCPIGSRSSDDRTGCLTE